MSKRYIKYLIIIIIIFIFIYYYNKSKAIEKYTSEYSSIFEPLKKLQQNGEDPLKIPIVLICWNNLTFVKGFVDQLKKYKNPIVLLDNNSDYAPMQEYYKNIKDEQITVVLLDKNYGHTVYEDFKQHFPNIYILSDTDLELNKDMPDNFAEILLQVSNKYKSHKIGLALNLDDKDNFMECDIDFYNIEIQYWREKVDDYNYELYKADTDTTFCLINNNYGGNNIRIAKNFTARHLPWYKDYIINHIPKDEFDHWSKMNTSSSILKCLQNVTTKLPNI
jgi:hypothetical protein